MHCGQIEVSFRACNIRSMRHLTEIFEIQKPKNFTKKNRNHAVQDDEHKFSI
jgi:hypothetical protein